MMDASDKDLRLKGSKSEKNKQSDLLKRQKEDSKESISTATNSLDIYYLEPKADTELDISKIRNLPRSSPRT